MAWMTAEAAVAITAGVLASSIALVGFGLDSVIEFFAAAIVVWQLRGEGAGERETRAVRLIGVTFFALAVYLAVEGIRDLVSHARPGQSAAGLAVTGAALLVMPALAVAKRRTGHALGNRTLIADSAETAFCAFTSAAALLGVGLNSWLGWWWADPAGQRVALAALLTAALQHHQAHGDGDCPVCGRPGALTRSGDRPPSRRWRGLGQEAQDAEDAERAAAEARRHALTLVQPCPLVLSEAAPWGVDPGPALAAWARWVAVPDPVCRDCGGAARSG